MNDWISQRRPEYREVIGAEVNVLQTIVYHLHIDGVTRTVTATRGFCVNLLALAAMSRVILGHRNGLELSFFVARVHSTEDDAPTYCETPSYAGIEKGQGRKQST
jgi:hypothetical protein